MTPFLRVVSRNRPFFYRHQAFLLIEEVAVTRATGSNRANEFHVCAAKVNEIEPRARSLAMVAKCQSSTVRVLRYEFDLIDLL